MTGGAAELFAPGFIPNKDPKPDLRQSILHVLTIMRIPVKLLKEMVNLLR